MACVQKQDLSDFCRLAGIQKGENAKATCLSIVQRVREKRKCMRKDDLQKLVAQLGLDQSGTIDTLLNRLEAYSHEQSATDEKREATIVAASIKKNVNKVSLIETIVYKLNGDRVMTVVPVPKNAFNDQGRWLPSGGVTPGYLLCKNCGFYLSTGTSNAGQNFPGMWFPFVRVQTKAKEYSYEKEKGWIYKAYNLSTAKLYLERLKARFGIQITDFLLAFMEKFSHHWQIQISAALPSDPESLWNTHRELMTLKPIVLAFDYFNFPERGEPFVANAKIATEYEVPRVSATITRPEEVNTWLEKNGALCVEKD